MRPLERLRGRRAAKLRAREESAQRLSALAGRQWDLLLDGTVQGRLTLEVVSWPPQGNGWIFWHITWADGTTNYPGIEDYGPHWATLDAVEAGTFEELVITEVTPDGVEICHEVEFALREVPPERHAPFDREAQARNRRHAPWRPTPR